MGNGFQAQLGCPNSESEIVFFRFFLSCSRWDFAWKYKWFTNLQDCVCFRKKDLKIDIFELECFNSNSIMYGFSKSCFDFFSFLFFKWKSPPLLYYGKRTTVSLIFAKQLTVSWKLKLIPTIALTQWHINSFLDLLFGKIRYLV